MLNQKSERDVKNFKRYLALIFTLFVLMAAVSPFGLMSASADEDDDEDVTVEIEDVSFEVGKRKQYTAPVTAIRLEQSGYYFVEAWGTDGAKGGVGSLNINSSAAGGKAVREKGLFHFDEGTVIYIQAGEKPNGDKGGRGKYFGSGGNSGTLSSTVGIVIHVGSEGGGGGAASGILVNGTKLSDIYLASGGGGGGGGSHGTTKLGAKKSLPGEDGKKGNEGVGGFRGSNTNGDSHDQIVVISFSDKEPGMGGGGGGGYDGLAVGSGTSGGGGNYGENGAKISASGLSSANLKARSGGGGGGGKNYDGKGKTVPKNVADKLNFTTPINNQPKDVGGLVYITMLAEDGGNVQVVNLDVTAGDKIIVVSYANDNRVIDVKFDTVESGVTKYTKYFKLNDMDAKAVKLFRWKDYTANIQPQSPAINMTKSDDIWINAD